MVKNILVAAAFERGRGTGHLVRSARLVTELRSRGFEARLCLQGGRGWRGVERITPFLNKAALITSQHIKNEKWDLIVTDRYKTPKEEIELYKTLAPVIGIDEGGKARKNFDFLLDILAQNIKPPPNESFPLLSAGIVPQKDDGIGLPLKTLITFGGEDRAMLGFKTCIRLLGTANVVCTPLSAHIKAPMLREALFQFDLVITHYGLTAYESLAANVPVLLVHPTALHRSLAERAGFWPLSKMPLKNTPEWVRDVLKPHCAALLERYKSDEAARSLCDYIADMSPVVYRACPACGAALGNDANNQPLARFPGRGYKKCPACGMIFMEREREPPIEYSDKYFFDDYKKQYGKTYIEDFQHLKNLAKERVSHIKEILDENEKKALPDEAEKKPAKRGLKLLDIGSAYGPFLAAAKEAGFFMPLGFDPSENAVQYTKHELGIYALKGFFPNDCGIEGGSAAFWEKDYFDALSMWYVIEHFADLKTALEKAALLLKKNGVFAFSTPSASGVSALFSKKDFLRKSPEDHWTIWPPLRVKNILKSYGFLVKKVIITGHHPERFPLWGRVFGKKVLLKISKAAGLGDTFEVYAVKE